MMREYPSDTKFYINAWTAGYEDLLKGVASEFGSKVCNVHRYIALVH